jgi:hypothetical protein
MKYKINKLNLIASYNPTCIDIKVLDKFQLSKFNLFYGETNNFRQILDSIENETLFILRFLKLLCSF